MPELVVARTYPARIHADLARSALAASGIDCLIEGDDAGRERRWPNNEVRLLVAVDDLEAVNDILGPPEGFTS